MSTKILIADDDGLSLGMLRGVLSKSGYEVVSANNGNTAWELLQSNDAPRLAILDWGMPGLEGIEICRRLRQLRTNTPCYVILITARNTKADIVSGLQAGANDFITKPFDRSELLARVQVGRTVTELQAEIQALASRDSLTKLLNRHALTEEADREWSRSNRFQGPLSCVMLDIDYFKKINDTHGHLVGDVVIASVADVLRQGSRVSDVIARYGGEEFCALLPETNESQAAHWAEQIRIKIENLKISSGDATVQVTVSLGVAEHLETMAKPNELIEESDQCLLFAKQSGRNRVMVASHLSGARADLEASKLGIPAHITVAEIMTPILATLSGSATLFEATRFLLDLHLDAVPVVDPEGRLIDFLSEEEISKRLCSGKDWQTRLSDCVMSKPACLDVHASASAAFKFLMRVSVRRLAILEGERPVGMVSRATLLRWLGNRALEQQQRSKFNKEPDRTTSAIQNQETLRLVLNELQRHARRLCDKIDEGECLELHDILISATRMQALCEDTFACVSRLDHSNSVNATLSACLE
ncbi:MAG: diguanylate cyclase [Pirellula sp.]